MNFGGTFRKIRKQRKISLKELAGDAVSYSSLATFERDESKICFETLSLLLKKLQLSLDEFICLSLTIKIETDYEIFSKKASKFLHTRDSQNLSILATQEFKKYTDSNLQFHKCNEIICKAAQSTFDKEILIKDNDKSFLMDYLWRIEIWTKYELSVLNYSLSIIHPSSLSIFLNEIWESLPDDFSNDKLHSYKFNLINSMIALLIERDELNEAKIWILKLKNKLHGSQVFFEMIYLYMLELLFEKKINPNMEVNQKFDDLKNVLTNIGAINYAQHFEAEWNNLCY